MDVETGLIVGFAAGALWGCICAYSAYFNGATDGFGYCMEPDHPGYQKAGRYLRKFLYYRWPEKLKENSND